MIEEGCNGLLTQALGGSFTVYIDGSLFRIDGADADAIGKEPIAARTAIPKTRGRRGRAPSCCEDCARCHDPEIPCSIVDLGLIYVCEVHTARRKAGCASSSR